MSYKKELSAIRKYMLANSETLAVAESVTSGHLQAALSLATDAMKFFQGGITTYNLGQKARHLSIDPIHALSCNCVSGKIAEQMAIGAAKLFSSHWGIGITGYATPDPEQGIDSLFAFYSIAHGAKPVASKMIRCKKKSIASVQEFYTIQVLQDFVSHLKS